MKPLAILLSAIALAGCATNNETKWIYEPSGAWRTETNAVVVEPAGAEREVIVVPETEARDINQHPYTQPFGTNKYPPSRVTPVTPQPQMDLDEDDEPRHLDQHIL